MTECLIILPLFGCEKTVDWKKSLSIKQVWTRCDENFRKGNWKAVNWTRRGGIGRCDVFLFSRALVVHNFIPNVKIPQILMIRTEWWCFQLTALLAGSMLANPVNGTWISRWFLTYILENRHKTLLLRKNYYSQTFHILVTERGSLPIVRARLVDENVGISCGRGRFWTSLQSHNERIPTFNLVWGSTVRLSFPSRFHQ